ncbi:hypothetical protein [Thermoleptolyngbya sp.]
MDGSLGAVRVGSVKSSVNPLGRAIARPNAQALNPLSASTGRIISQSVNQSGGRPPIGSR